MALPEVLPTPDMLTSSLLAGNRGKPAALDLAITSPLCSAILGESCHQAGVAALAAEARKLLSNGPKCQELGWSSGPASHWQWKLMAIGASRPMMPSPG